jgi:hypothetical protein
LVANSIWPSLSSIRREAALMVGLEEGALFLKKQGRHVAEEQELRASRFYFALVGESSRVVVIQKSW